jgi:hypothetical protein
MERELPKGFERGPLQGHRVIGEVTESLHRFLMDGWKSDNPPPRIEEDISFVPKDREEVIYIYMYRLANNSALQNSKRWREARVTAALQESAGVEQVFYERPPLYLDLYYLISVHSKCSACTRPRICCIARAAISSLTGRRSTRWARPGRSTTPAKKSSWRRSPWPS